MRIVYLSASICGYEWLKEILLNKECQVVAIITLNKSAKTKMYDGIENEKWQEFSLPVYEIFDINKEIPLLKTLKGDCLIVGGWRQIIGREVLSLFKKGVIGFHPTLLPKGRGPSPIINSIMAGIRESGLTMFYYTEKLDAGPIIGQKEFIIEDDDYAWDVYKKEIEKGKELIREYLPLIIKDKVKPRLQDERFATYFPKLDKKVFNEINLKDGLIYNYRKIRALSKYGKKELGLLSYEGAYFYYNNKKIIVWKALPKEKNFDGLKLDFQEGSLFLEKIEIDKKEYEGFQKKFNEII
ncbi:MAG: formyltransferase family protein [candidate division WOR-3 bacterium]